MNGLKAVVLLMVLAAVGIVGFDLLNPVWVGRDLDATAGAAAGAAEAAYFRSGGNADEAQIAARRTAQDAGAALTAFTITSGGGTSVTVTREARSILLGNLGIEKLDERALVSATATAAAKAGPPPSSTTAAP